MLTKEPKMLHPDAFCEHTTGYSKMLLHSGLRYGPGAPPRTPLGELTAIPVDPMEALQGRPPTQNFDCVGHNIFGPIIGMYIR